MNPQSRFRAAHDVPVHRKATRLLHWTTAMLIALATGAIVLRSYVETSANRKVLLGLHQSVGVIILILTMMRVLWRASGGIGQLHSTIPKAMRISGGIAHIALYANILVLTTLGWLTSDALGHPLRVFDLPPLPALIERNRDLADDLQSWHLCAAWCLLALVVVHVAAALWHHYGRRDDVLRSMTPFRAWLGRQGRRRRRLDKAGWLVVLCLSAGFHPAWAVPSFSSQTGQACAACHIGAYGPQLTAYGSRFKIGGYTERGGDKDSVSIPLDLMFVESYTNTSKAQSTAPAPYFSTNGNFAMDELSLQLSGGLTDHIGSYWEWSYNQIERKVSTENMDIRYTTPYTVAGLDAILGVSTNNNPTVSDPFNTLPAIKFPYMMSSLTPMPDGSPLLAGTLTKQVIGTTIYTFIDKSWYAEAGGYRSLSSDVLRTIHVDDSAGSVDGIAPYWRFAYTHDSRRQAYSVGIVGMNAHLHPDRLPGATDDYRDIGLDASYQFLGNRSNIFTLNADYIHEHQNLYASYLDGAAAQANHALNSMQIDGSYFFHQSYGVTLGWFDNHSTGDRLMYTMSPDSGSRTGKPDSVGTTMEFDWTPFGREDSWLAPFMNLRVGLQYVAYSKFNGSSIDYDGYGRNASDNNTLYLVLSTIF